MNRIIIYISGFVGFLLISLYILGLFADKSYGPVVLIIGNALIILVCIPMILLERYRHDRKVDEIIHSHQKSKKEKIGHSNKEGQQVKGWSMNDSPFRERRSGVKWSGGNIHGAIPKREGRKGLFRS
jgi:hypothetical protein